MRIGQRYGAVKDVSDDNYMDLSVPNGCTAVHLNLVARHGTRAPTKKRIKELDQLSYRLKELLNDAERKASDGDKSLESIPTWLRGWQSPWQGRKKGGELISLGENELYDLAIRVREMLPELFNEEYHPDVFPIKTTQVPRASASAVAFGIGLFSERGSLGPGRHRAFVVTSESRASDIHLRFYDTCTTYKQYRESQEPSVQKLKEPTLLEVSSALKKRYHLNFTVQDICSLWFLCKQEASLLDKTDQACALFSPTEVALLEWTDDLEIFILKGYGKSLNYRMGVPLLRDVFYSMEQAIVAREENCPLGTYEKARLRFAHAETVIPFTCLLGLFLEGLEFEKIQKEEPLELPPKPPKERKWRGSIVAPFAGNNMLVLYECKGNSSQSTREFVDSSGKYFVQVLHNEKPTLMPGCGNNYLCPFDIFKEKVVDPHLKHSFNLICNARVETTEICSIACKFIRFFSRLVFLKGDEKSKSGERAEL
ncbi:multiple inositol polyphosphate phosphatase 1 isoform X2 [Amborella trichopoda]|uniref:multiple inositol polyphosphate phosphatase 1 isoform X2 n=1 Tax=Amborella trichopoda TaxID=13333 RepID=UPI0009C0BFBA|nr:multiple inositol polyphosphate phosphatase 1 isoform X2 [Amborella trichopoda]|eukprot:XP_020522523.1 multiple inositol polyphosphate phosphatase 1 isoform X2 [Amborella trichopoda]